MKLETKKLKQRTLQQNRALHLYFTHLADELNSAGLDMRKVLKPSVDIPWTTMNIKNFLWRPIQKAYLNKDSTTKLNSEEIDKVFEILNRHLAKFGVSMPFPCIDELEK